MPKRRIINTPLSFVKSAKSMPKKLEGKTMNKERKSKRTPKSHPRTTKVGKTPVIRVPAIAIQAEKEKRKKEKTPRVKTLSNPANKTPRTPKSRRQRIFDVEPSSAASLSAVNRRRKERLIKRMHNSKH